MRKIVLLSTLALCFLLSATISYGQARQKPPVKPVSSALKNMLGGSGLPFKLVNDSLAVVPYGGENITSYNVIVQAASDLYIVSVNLSEALPGKLNESKFKYLLQRNNDFDLIKTAIEGDDNTVYVRADVFKAMTNTALLTRIIKQVANVANIIGGDMK